MEKICRSFSWNQMIPALVIPQRFPFHSRSCSTQSTVPEHSITDTLQKPSVLYSKIKPCKLEKQNTLFSPPPHIFMYPQVLQYLM